MTEAELIAKVILMGLEKKRDAVLSKTAFSKLKEGAWRLAEVMGIDGEVSDHIDRAWEAER